MNYRWIARLVLFLSLAPLPVVSQEVPSSQPPTEAPESLYLLGPDNDAVALDLTGFWESSLTLGGGWAYRPGLGLGGGLPPGGLTQGVFFSQSPQLTVSLSLFDAFFFYLDFLGSLDERRIGVAYEGDGTVKEVAFGNRDRTIPGFALAPPTQIIGEPHLYARLSPDAGSEHQFAVLLAQSERREERFRGTNRLRTYRLDPGSFASPRLFVLPDSGVDNLVLYMRDDSGTVDIGGKSYRAVASSEGDFDAGQGFLLFDESPNVPVVVGYRKSGKLLGDPALGTASYPAATNGLVDSSKSPENFFQGMIDDFGIDLANRFVTLPSGDRGFLIFVPDSFNPFAYYGEYPLPEGEAAEARWINAVDFQVGSMTVIEDSVAIGTPFSRDPYARFPLSMDVPEIYGSSATPATPADPLIFETTVTHAALTLDQAPKPDSVFVTVNGIRIPDVTVSGSSVTVDPPPGPFDSVTVSYVPETLADESDSLRISAVEGSRIQLPLGELQFSTDIQWDVAPNTQSSPGNPHAGAVRASSRYRATSDGWSVDVAGSFGLVAPDTTGTLIVLPDGDGTTPLSPYAALPAGAADLSAPQSQAPGYAGPVAFNESSRGVATYRDYYYESSPFLPPILGSLEGPQPDPDDTFVGPYQVLYSGEAALDLEYDLQSGQWVGTRLPLGPGMDLRGIQIDLAAFTGDALDGDLTLSVVAGRFDEDIDLDGTLDTVTGSAGISLDLPSGTKRAGRLPGASDETLVTEDFNANGIIDPAGPAGEIIALADIDPKNQTGVTITLTEGQRRALRHANALQIMVTNSSGSPRSGQIVLTRILATTGAFTPQGSSDAGAVGSAAVLTDPQDAGAEYFHFDVPGAVGSTQFVAWTEDWHPRDYATAVWSMAAVSPPTQGDTVSLGIRASGTDSPLVTFAVQPGIDYTGWHTYELDWRAGILTMDGTIHPVVAAAGVLPNIADGVYVAFDSATGNSWLLDDLRFTDPRPTLDWNGLASTQVALPGIGSWAPGVTGLDLQYSGDLSDDQVHHNGQIHHWWHQELLGTRWSLDHRYDFDGSYLGLSYDAGLAIGPFEVSDFLAHDPDTGVDRQHHITWTGNPSADFVVSEKLRDTSTRVQRRIETTWEPLTLSAQWDQDLLAEPLPDLAAALTSTPLAIWTAGDLRDTLALALQARPPLMGQKTRFSVDGTDTRSYDQNRRVVDFGARGELPFPLGPFAATVVSAPRITVTRAYEGNSPWDSWNDGLPTPEQTMIPWVGFFLPASRGLDRPVDEIQRTYENTDTLTLTRTEGSVLLDLVVPYFLGIDLTSAITVGDLGADDQRSLRVKTSTGAVNLFGTFGSVPLFPRVVFDEHGVDLDVQYGLDGTWDTYGGVFTSFLTQNTSINAETSLRFVADGGYGFENSAQTSIGRSWPLTTPLTWWRVAFSTLNMESGAELTWSTDGDTLPAVIAAHQSVTLGEKASVLSATLSVSYSSDWLDNSAGFNLGLELSVKGRLEF